jgi:biotin operon repressor
VNYIYSDKDLLKLSTEPGMTQQKLAEQLGIGRGAIAHAIRREKERQENKKDLSAEIQAQLMKGATRDKLREQLGISDRVLTAAIEELREHGLQVEESKEHFYINRLVVPQDENLHEAPWKGDKMIRFGLCGDIQLNSKYTQITHANTLYDYYQSEGIKDVYNTGDLDEGEKMRPGHQYECYTQGADDHVKEIIKNYPKRDGIKTYFITGNHDHSLIKLAGFDLGIPVAEAREDMVYLGQSYATINLTPNCTLELRHPLDGTAYALSYKSQKMIEAMSGGEKPNILAIGHYHKVEYLFYRNVHVYQTGCLQAQTPFMRGKQLSAHLGGWIVEAHVDAEGTITRIKHELIPFYEGIKDDYLNWR